MKHAPLFLFALLFAAATYTGMGCGYSSPPPPQTTNGAELTGTVRDAVNGAPLYPASVTVTQGGVPHGTATNPGGLYFMGDLAIGPAHVMAEAPGHETLEKDIRLTAGSNSLPIELRRRP